MRILYVFGMSESENIVETLEKMGYDVLRYPQVMDNSIMEKKEIDEVVDYIRDKAVSHLMSIHLIYSIAVAAYWSGIKYIPIIWDAPYLKAYTVMGRLDNIWYSSFDKLDCQRMREGGCPHVLYQPLSVNRDNVLKWNSKARINGKYISDISFVASLYEKNDYDRNLNKIPDNMQEYFRSIFEEAAFKWDGVNRIYGQTGNEILEYIKLVSPEFKFENPYDIEDVRFFETAYLIRKIANIERVCVLNMLAENHRVALYTISKTDQLLSGVTVMPPAAAGERAAYVYAGSKINLNISLKGIEGGTPQRIMDILGAGGFALTNYCQETAELFEEDKEIVMFRSPEEMLEKVDYYLSHDEEREHIAEVGQKKVLECYTYEKKLTQLLDWVESSEKQGAEK